MKRNEFIHQAGRWGLLSILALITGYLIVNRRVKIDADHCNTQFCKQCRDLGACSKPEALKARQYEKG